LTAQLAQRADRIFAAMSTHEVRMSVCCVIVACKSDTRGHRPLPSAPSLLPPSLDGHSPFRHGLSSQALGTSVIDARQGVVTCRQAVQTAQQQTSAKHLNMLRVGSPSALPQQFSPSPELFLTLTHLSALHASALAPHAAAELSAARGPPGHAAGSDEQPVFHSAPPCRFRLRGRVGSHSYDTGNSRLGFKGHSRAPVCQCTRLRLGRKGRPFCCLQLACPM
jgi:hypothetical protein